MDNLIGSLAFGDLKVEIGRRLAEFDHARRSTEKDSEEEIQYETRVQSPRRLAECCAYTSVALRHLLVGAEQAAAMEEELHKSRSVEVLRTFLREGAARVVESGDHFRIVAARLHPHTGTSSTFRGHDFVVVIHANEKLRPACRVFQAHQDAYMLAEDLNKCPWTPVKDFEVSWIKRLDELCNARDWNSRARKIYRALFHVDLEEVEDGDLKISLGLSYRDGSLASALVDLQAFQSRDAKRPCRTTFCESLTEDLVGWSKLIK